MFDPTAYENLKVVLQGALYELELLGSLKVVNREDIVDLASLARRYSLTLCNPVKEDITVTVTLSAGAKEWNAEAFPEYGGEPGARLQVLYESEGSPFPETFISGMEEWWGERRKIEWREVTSTLHPSFHQAIIDFNRIITEEMVDDLEEVVLHIENSLLKLF
ncbi:hypothetical protein FZC79_06580 [Rossellomorea vietnamensis]|uniref:Uncharacterized protein n=1 Tax=Rossellomorea vietnamensis TaxID=218284 RepID=A0A5D4KGY0_9BACI|nr:hypothetical protein [Rossellomorea vietnamensis]TYR76541.1 hypothetical protein FZC79_06580 [Rossellomorea vietnamensis]